MNGSGRQGGRMGGRAGKARMMYRAMRGDPSAARQLLLGSMDVYRGKIDEMVQEVEYHREHSWDEDRARELAYGDEPASPEQVLAAFSEINSKLLFICALFPVMIEAPEEEIQAYERAIRETTLDLILLLHSPEIRYSIVGGFRDDPVETDDGDETTLRRAVDDYLDRMSLILWGTIDAVLADEAGLEDLPTETQEILENMAAFARQRQGG